MTEKAKADPFRHFLDAQARVFPFARDELVAGQKRTHWMWFIFPCLAGLSSSAMSRNFALASLDDARDFARHPVLGARLVEASEAVLSHVDERGQPTRTALEIFGALDEPKFHSSMTLFARAVPDEPVFQSALDFFFDGGEQIETASLLTALQKSARSLPSKPVKGD